MIKKNITFSLVVLTSIHLHANISGVVYQDLPMDKDSLNTYGIQDTNEVGIQNVTVRAYPSGQTTTTDREGKWNLAVNQKSRIEFTNWPQYLEESPLNSSIQFLENGSTGNLGLHDSTHYSNSSNPFYVTNIQLNGTSDNQESPSIEFMHYKDKGLNSSFQAPRGLPPLAGPLPLVATKIKETGSIWGKAIQKNQKRIFASTVLQRHIDFAPNKGVGEIYVIDYQALPHLKGSFTLQGKTPTNGGANIDLGTVCRENACINNPGNTGIARDYLLNQGPSSPNIDLDAFKKIGKISYGDITFDEHTNKLWLVNLYQKSLISVDVSGDFNSLANTSVSQYPISNISNLPNCTGGILRPWAVKIHHDKLYLGAVCDASNSQSKDDLKAYILSTSTTTPTTFVKELEINLNYNKDGSDWNPWSDIDRKIGTNWKEYIQPVLSNIEFDKNNNMYLSFLDRYGLQSGYRNYAPESNNSIDIYETNNTLVEKTHSYGEIFKVCDINNTFILEGNGLCNQVNYPISSEFFNDIGGSRNLDASMGSLALLPGSNQILATIIDPHPEGALAKEYWNTLGTSTLSLEDGSIENWYSNIYSGNKQLGYNGKAQGMGEIEILTAPAPIEIGNRVWLDNDGDGIQDATENGINNINVQLIQNNNIIATTTTDNKGNFLFSSNNITDLIPANNYSIRIPDINGSNQQAPLKNLKLTLKNIGEGNNKYENDSDAEIINQNAEINIIPSDIPFSGANNHSFDIGFKPDSNINVYMLGDRVWLDNNKDGIQNNNEIGIDGIKVNLYENVQCTGAIKQTRITNNGGNYLFQNLLASTYCIKFTNIPSTYQITRQNRGTDTNNSDSNNNGEIPNIILNNNNRNEDMGLYAVSRVTPIPTVINTPRLYNLGDKVWLDGNHNGIQENNESGINNITVNLYSNNNCTGNINLTTSTQNGGFYRFNNLSIGEYCIEFTNLPVNYTITTANRGIRENDSDANINAQITNIQLNETDLNEDMGIYPRPLVEAVTRTVCTEMHLENDQLDANNSNPKTVIDVLNNDRGNKDQQRIKFININDGKTLWEEEKTPTSQELLDTLTVKDEGVWSVENNQIVFTAYNSFDGQIPTPIYYVVLGENCTNETQYSNVAQVSITSPCTCPSYTKNSVGISHLYTILMIFFTSLFLIFFIIKDEAESNLI